MQIHSFRPPAKSSKSANWLYRHTQTNHEIIKDIGNVLINVHNDDDEDGVGDDDDSDDNGGNDGCQKHVMMMNTLSTAHTGEHDDDYGDNDDLQSRSSVFINMYNRARCIFISTIIIIVVGAVVAFQNTSI